MQAQSQGAVGFLSRIVEERRRAVAAARQAQAETLGVEAPRAPRPFGTALRVAAARHGLALIAEIKRASPSKGPLAPELDPAALAAAYAAAGAAALSVLTEPTFFQARPDDLPRARAAVPLPVLRKEFIVDPWQLRETVGLGADAVLLIVAVLGSAVGRFVAEALELGLEPLVEVHDAAELELALKTAASCIGINNRDLRTFQVDPAMARRLAPRAAAAGRVVVAESGIGGPEDLGGLREAGVTAVLVGEALVRAADPAAAVRRLLQGAAAVG